MSTPLVSVVIPTYNRPDYLSSAITSVLEQSYCNFEIVVVDNASNKDIRPIIDRLGDPRIVFYQNPTNIGGVRNYDRACRLARGEYVHIFSDDDLMLPGCIEKKVSLAQNEDVAVVHSGIRMIDSSGRVLANAHWAQNLLDNFTALPQFTQRDTFRTLFYINNFVSMSSVLIKRSVLERFDFFNTDIGFLLDYELWLKTSLFYRFGFVPEALVSYRFHNSNWIALSNSQIELSEAYKIRRKLRANFPSHPWIAAGARYSTITDLLICAGQKLRTIRGGKRILRFIDNSLTRNQ